MGVAWELCVGRLWVAWCGSCEGAAAWEMLHGSCCMRAAAWEELLCTEGRCDNRKCRVAISERCGRISMSAMALAVF
eukprot:13286434-Alexandrium_andersonii.AAC.1